MTFTSGQVSVQVRYKDVGQIQLERKEGDTGGGSPAFVVHPADIVVTAVHDGSGSANPGAGAMNGTGNVAGTLTGNVGRFTPASLVLTASFISGSCANRTYMGRPGLALSYPIEARGTASNVLRNYDSGLVSAGNLASLSLVAENANSGADLSARLSALAST